MSLQKKKKKKTDANIQFRFSLEAIQHNQKVTRRSTFSKWHTAVRSGRHSDRIHITILSNQILQRHHETEYSMVSMERYDARQFSKRRNVVA